MIPHTKAGYRQYADRLADQECSLGGGREVSLQLDLYYRVNAKCSGSTKRRDGSLGKAWQFGLYILTRFFKKFFEFL